MIVSNAYALCYLFDDGKKPSFVAIGYNRVTNKQEFYEKFETRQARDVRANSYLTSCSMHEQEQEQQTIKQIISYLQQCG